MFKSIRRVCFVLLFLALVSHVVLASGLFLVEITCETEIEGASLLTGAIDGSQYYFTNAQIDFPGLEEDNMDLLVWSMDIRFDQEGSGFTIMGTDEKIGTSIRSHTRRDQYHLSAQAGSTVFTPYTVIEPDAWYHVELMGKFSAPDSFMYLLLWRYDEGGQRKNLQIFSNVSRRNLNANVNQGASFIRVEPNTSIDNLRIFHPAVDHLVILAPTDLVVAGQDLQFISEGSRYGIDINVEGIVDYIILDANSEPLNDDQITIDKNGLLQVGEFVPDQSILIKAFDSEGTASDPFALAIKSRLPFQILSIGLNAELTQIVDIEIEKNFVYEDTVVCLIEIYDQDQVLQVSATRNINANLIPVKQSLKIPLNYPLPESFDNQTWQVKVSLLSSVE